VLPKPRARVLAGKERTIGDVLAACAQAVAIEVAVRRGHPRRSHMKRWRRGQMFMRANGIAPVLVVTGVCCAVDKIGQLELYYIYECMKNRRTEVLNRCAAIESASSKS
jgi:hypothetical protein